MAPTSPELILEVIAGLKAAGIPYKDMVLFDRYKGEFLQAGYDKIVPRRRDRAAGSRPRATSSR